MDSTGVNWTSEATLLLVTHTTLVLPITGLPVVAGVVTPQAELDGLGQGDSLLYTHHHVPRAPGGVVADVVVVDTRGVPFGFQVLADPTTGVISWRIVEH